ncbi:MAG: preprotein translocase subunit SecY [Lachnobacterium sp.]|nr:preprotein translocase subunit SecY [Lachnobacterium sp.]
MKKKAKEHILLYKILYSLMVMFVYMIGRNIPLYGVDVEAYRDVDINAQSIIIQAVSGDMKNCSIFILGLWPYMLASMLIVLVVAIATLDKTRRISPKKVNIWTVTLMLIIGILQAYERVQNYIYKVDGTALIQAKTIAFVELIAGMLIVVYLGDRATKYGICGKTSVFLVNIVDGMMTMLVGQPFRKLWLIIVIGIIEIAVMLVLENTEKRIAVQRVSIHNIHADKDYIAYKMNPVGVTPMMFASAAFILPQSLFGLLNKLFPESGTIEWIYHRMNLTSVLGVWVYIAIIVILTIAFSFIMLTPGKTAEDLLKSGDSILGVYAGRETKRYLQGCVLSFSLISSVVIGICVGVPLFLQFGGYINSKLAMFPCSIMMFTGIWISFGREAEVYRNMDRYEPFI